MDTRIRPTAGDRRVYEDFIPSHELRGKEGPVPTFVVRLPGFKREQIRVQIDNYGKLRISGERLLADNRWSRFRKDFQAPENCNVSEVRAKFENEVLEVMLPKLISEPQQLPPQKPEVLMKPSAAEDADTKPKAPAEPNDAAKKQEEEEEEKKKKKKREQIEEERSKVPQKVVEEKEKEQRNKDHEKQKEKVAEAAVDKEGEKGDAVVTGTVAKKEPGAGVSSRVGKLKQKVGELGLSFFYKPKHPMVNIVVVAIAVLVGVGVYLYHKLSRTMEKGAGL